LLSVTTSGDDTPGITPRTLNAGKTFSATPVTVTAMAGVSVSVPSATRPTTGPDVLWIVELKPVVREVASEPVPKETGLSSFISAAAAVRRSFNLVAKAQASIELEAENDKVRHEAHDPLQ
jgi:hypothetical protein